MRFGRQRLTAPRFLLQLLLLKLRQSLGRKPLLFLLCSPDLRFPMSGLCFQVSVCDAIKALGDIRHSLLERLTGLVSDFLFSRIPVADVDAKSPGRREGPHTIRLS